MAERCYMSLAKDLWATYHRKLYTQWGFETFDDYVKEEVGISKDYAARMRRIFSVFVLKCGVRPNDLDKIGRSKAQVLLPVVSKDKFSAKKWVQKAKELTYDDLVTEVRNSRRQVKTIRPISVSPAGEPTVKLSSVKKPVPEESEEEATTNAFRRRVFNLPETTDALLDEALGEAQRITDSASPGFNLRCIAQHFLSHRMTTEGKKDGRLRWFMRHLEEIYGVRLIEIKSDEAWSLLEETITGSPEHFGTSDKENKNERGCNNGEAQADTEPQSS